SCEISETGPQNPLDQYGYSRDPQHTGSGEAVAVLIADGQAARLIWSLLIRAGSAHQVAPN
ncbi:hypothetical protein, partial [Microvirga aerilata]|uniref:hypothetical protein n=1 Tax=Microvirga aerilata TaxID=670292 RepID=UPI00361713C7